MQLEIFCTYLVLQDHNLISLKSSTNYFISSVFEIDRRHCHQFTPEVSMFVEFTSIELHRIVPGKIMARATVVAAVVVVIATVAVVRLAAGMAMGAAAPPGGQGRHRHDYGAALAKSLLYFEAQRAGKLPPTQRVAWRGDSALDDGRDHGVDLSGGYYDSGDNVKFGLPMAFTVTTLAWGVVEYGDRLAAAGELGHALEAVRWGADYFVRAHAAAEALYVQVGDGNSDHACWERPEDMDTPRTAYMVDPSHPGSDVAAETAAALAAAAMAFTPHDATYAATLLTHAKQLFDFAKNHRGLYQHSIPTAGGFYPSSDDQDEMLWAAAWLFIASGDKEYKDYIAGAGYVGGLRSFFSWDDKFVGAQALVTKLILEGKLPDTGNLAAMKSNLEQFICGVMQHGNGGRGRLSSGGLLWVQPWNNNQYVTAAALVLAAHADHLAAAGDSLQCGSPRLSPDQLISLVKSQVDYILGTNPQGMSYMVGYGERYPVQVHHRGASLPSIKSSPAKISCNEGFDYLNKASPNLNVIQGAIVGGPDANDKYTDSRSNYMQGEASTVNVAPIVGVLARLLHR